ncbi:DUF1549 and DUF1553 domain-containing protein [Lentisphaera profundi]|uniref:DUF1549 and DUF1553 domain-containing protein n=1 Tax=Lentisphaera profundi TaxID=1658616 RepID=A0ABY7VPY1_9BACT|nr:DUF1549 and DUF1553 domain-containing protein [Lentisphaera profundi]WDE95305.1 DUF1549 and DUF1553 domain-containing protein [Lentisphaera profundi]
MRYFFIISILFFVSNLFAEDLIKQSRSSVSDSITEFRVLPLKISLDHQDDFQHIIAQGIRSDLSTLDLSKKIEVVISDKAICSFENGQFKGLKKGKTEVLVSFKDKQEKLVVEVKNDQVKESTSFALDIIPIFTGAGCNSGGCHGASRGQEKFHLSLFGYDPQGDFKRIKYDLSGRRLNLAVPADSLLLQKAVKTVPHTGGELFKQDSFHYKTILAWLSAGAPADEKDLKKAVTLEIFPKQSVLFSGDKQKISVRVKYSDGSDRDVTSLCAFFTSDSNSAEVKNKDHIQTKTPGEAHLMVRYGTLNALSSCIVIPLEKQDFVPIEEKNYVDRLNNQKWKRLRMQPNTLCSDEVFIRRIYLDLCGRLPQEDELDSFIKDKNKDKRDLLVDKLAISSEFMDLWAMKLSELLQIRTDNNYDLKNVILYSQWIRDQFHQGKKYDEIIYQLLTASGDSFANPAANFYQIQKDNKIISENVAQVFMGIRLQCSQCHNHPFDRWTMDDYYSYASFFAQVGRKNAEDPRAQIIYDKNSGDIKHPVYKKGLEPKYLGGEQVKEIKEDRRELLAQWLTDKKNPYFASALANRMWEHFFARGIIQPVDDRRLSNPAANPELLEALSQKFIDYDFDLIRLAKDICKSNTYSLSSESLDSKGNLEKYFARAPIRRIRAEVLLNSISQITETKDYFSNSHLSSKATQLLVNNSGSTFLSTFGRVNRKSPTISCESITEPNLAQSLELLNGNVINGKINGSLFINRAISEKWSPEKYINTTYRRALCRDANEQEMKQLKSVYENPENPREVHQDILWAILNSQEFIFVR